MDTTGPRPPSELTKITVFITEESSPFPPVYPDVLIYGIEVPDPNDEKHIAMEIAKIRYEENEGGDGPSPELLKEIAEGIKLHGAIKGDVLFDYDYRT